MRFIFALLLALFTAAPTFAVQVDELLPNPALELRAREISAGLRCLVCQNQSIDDSDAPLAKDLRVLVRERLTAGDSDEAVRSFLVARYGEFILLKPPFSVRTYVLWLFPLVCFGLALYVILRRRAPETIPAEAAPLTPEETEQLNALLEERP